MGTITRIESNTSTITTQLWVTDCPSCGVIFATTADLEKRRRADGERFYCPNGHGMTFGRSKADRLQEQLDAEQKRSTRLVESVERERQHTERERQRTEHERRRAAAAKGQLTKMRNRVARGVCPKQGCRRSFESLHEHVRHEHPELLDNVTEITSEE